VVAVTDQTPVPAGWPKRRLAACPDPDDGYPGHDVGGGD
jgi:hypothetical protein